MFTAAFSALIYQLQGASMFLSHQDQHEQEVEEFQREREFLRNEAETEFLKAANKGDANAVVDFAGTTPDWNARKGPHQSMAELPQRKQTLAEVMKDSLDYGNGPCHTQLMQLLLNVASGKQSPEVNAEQARKLINAMSESWARVNT